MDVHPFERCFQRLDQLPNHTGYRLQLAQRYAYVLPEPHLLDVIARYSPLLEVGAGTGYWAYLLRQRGADIIAYDQAPLGGERSNRYHYESWPWTEVLAGGTTVVQQHADRSLLICWPPLFSSLGQVLRFFTGKRVIYVGDHGHRTAWLAGLDAAFCEVECFEVIAMDPAPGVPARLSVWSRKPYSHRASARKDPSQDRSKLIANP
jgi:hypothetical protein